MGADTANTWAVTSNDAGTVGTVSFTSVQNLTGGSAQDDFTFNADLTGNVAGGGGNDTVVANTGATIGGNVEGGIGQRILLGVGLIATIIVTVYVTRIARRAIKEYVPASDSDTSGSAFFGNDE